MCKIDVEKFLEDNPILAEEIKELEAGDPLPGKQSDVQIGGDHYKLKKHQPLQIVLDDEGYEAFRGACLVKIYKYMSRKKENRKLDFQKAAHILNWLIEETE